MKLSKMSKSVLKYGLISVVCVLVIKLIIDHFNDRNTNNVQTKLDNVNAKINKLKSERAKNSESSKLNKIQKELNKAELERNHFLRILHAKNIRNNNYRNNRYNKLENRLAARIRNNDRKKLNKLSNKINKLMEEDEDEDEDDPTEPLYDPAELPSDTSADPTANGVPSNGEHTNVVAKTTPYPIEDTPSNDVASDPPPLPIIKVDGAASKNAPATTEPSASSFVNYRKNEVEPFGVDSMNTFMDYSYF